MQIDPLERTVLLDQILDILELLRVQAGICDEQDAPVDGPGLLEHPPDVFFCNVRKAAYLHAAQHHLAFFQHEDRMQQQCVAKDLYPF